MYLKLSFSHSKWVLQAILCVTVYSNGVTSGSNFDTHFSPDCIKFCRVVLCYQIGRLMRISKMCLKL